MTINYPLRQKHVVRVRPSIVLSELFQLAVERKDLDPARYELRHPTQPEVVLDLAARLSQYAVTEVTLVEKPHTSPPLPPYGELCFCRLWVKCGPAGMRAL